MRKKIIALLFLTLIAGLAFWFYHPLSNVHTQDVVQAKTATDSQVIRVIDGDTIVVALNHKPETIRLLGIDTPETVNPRKPVRCFGPEASKFAKETLTGKVVKLESDPSQDDRDKYHRLLRYVWLPDGTFFNENLVRDGYAREYTYEKPYQYQKAFRADQHKAKTDHLGLWGACGSSSF